MTQEISTGTLLGVSLVMLAAVVLAAFSIFTVAKKIMNNGMTQMQDALGAVEASVYQDYDQTTVTGTQVQTALKNFQGKDCAILIANASINSAVSLTTPYLTSIDAVKPAGANVQASNNAVPLVLYNKYYSPNKGEIGQLLKSSPTDSGQTLTGLTVNSKIPGFKSALSSLTLVDTPQLLNAANYTAFVVGGVEQTSGAGSTVRKDVQKLFYDLGNADCYIFANYNTELNTAQNQLWRDGGFYKFSGSYAIDAATNSFLINKNLADVWTSGTAEYVSGSAKYYANLIRDNTDTTIGIAFVQIKN